MASNPRVDQGVLSKLRGSVALTDFPELNVTASYLADEGISLAFEGEASAYLGTMTGAVPSPNPYQMATVTIHMLKTQSLANQWKAQIEMNTSIGDLTVTTDTATLDSYSLSNCTIRNVAELSFAGRDVGYTITAQGIYYINSQLFDQQ